MKLSICTPIKLIVGTALLLSSMGWAGELPRSGSAAAETEQASVRTAPADAGDAERTTELGDTFQDAAPSTAANGPSATTAASTATPAPTSPTAPAATGFLYQTIEHEGEQFAYCVYVPPNYSAERTWPVVLALHGSGERGSDGLLQTEVGIGRAIRRNYKRVPAIVVMPQCRPHRWWTDEMLELALQCVQQTSRDYRLDPARIYLTGLSMGGAGSWSLASALPEQFAAVAPICGFYGQLQAPADAATLTEFAKKLKGVPIWCFHGAADPAVPVTHSRAIVAALRAVGGDVQYTEYPDGKHNVWDRAYGDAAFWRWLFAQRREVSE